MPSRSILRVFKLFIALLALPLVGAVAHAGIIVVVGRPCPEIPVDERASSDDSRHASFETSSTRCVVMPDGRTLCAKSIRVEKESMLPPDWRCIPIGKSMLYCEVPAYGTSPGAGGQGDFEGFEEGDFDVFESEEIEALGCSSGAGVGGLFGVVGVLWVVLRRRRGCA